MVNLTATDIFDSAGAHIDSKPHFKALPVAGWSNALSADDPLAPPGT